MPRSTGPMGVSVKDKLARCYKRVVPKAILGGGLDVVSAQLPKTAGLGGEALDADSAESARPREGRMP